MGEASCLHLGNLVTAVDTLKQRYEQQSSTASEQGKQQLFDDKVFRATILLKKVPDTLTSWKKQLRFRLPHPYRSKSNTTVCLLCKDQFGGLKQELKSSEYDKSSIQIKQYLQESGFTTIDEVISYSHFMRAYNTQHAKEELARSFDMFVVDNAVTMSFMNALGKPFFKLNKVPWRIHLTPQCDVDAAINGQLEKTEINLGKFSNRVSCIVGRLDQATEEVVGNIRRLERDLQRRLPGKWANVRSIHLTYTDGVSLPLYFSLESANEVDLPPGRKSSRKAAVGELNTLESNELQNVRVHDDGRIDLITPDGRFVPTLHKKLRITGLGKRQCKTGAAKRIAKRAKLQAQSVTE